MVELPDDSNRNARRLGKFALSCDLLRRSGDLSQMLAALESCVVVRAETLWHLDAIEYIAIHPDFEPLPVGDEVPTYSCTFTRRADDGALHRTWERDGSCG